MPSDNRKGRDFMGWNSLCYVYRTRNLRADLNDRLIKLIRPADPANHHNLEFVGIWATDLPIDDLSHG